MGLFGQLAVAEPGFLLHPAHCLRELVSERRRAAVAPLVDHHLVYLGPLLIQYCVLNGEGTSPLETTAGAPESDSDAPQIRALSSQLLS